MGMPVVWVVSVAWGAFRTFSPRSLAEVLWWLFIHGTGGTYSQGDPATAPGASRRDVEHETEITLEEAYPAHNVASGFLMGGRLMPAFLPGIPASKVRLSGQADGADSVFAYQSIAT